MVHTYWVYRLTTILAIFPFLQTLSYLVASLYYTHVVACAILRGSQARIIKTILLFSFCYQVRNFFWFALDKKMPLANKGAQFCIQFHGHRQQQRKTMSELLNLLGDAAQQFLSKKTPVLRQFTILIFLLFTFAEYAGEISPSLRNGIYVVLIGSTVLTMCCFGLYC